jgi:3-hydroxymyristoyl/3-hydroxydecanoyl-(acyl carrier protein) dehydratase
MGDRVELCGDGFRHLGRADRVVKVGEKRLSLPEMEQHLAAHPWVAEAALLLRHLGGEARVHAVVALAPDGRAALARAGRRGLRAALETHLAERYDPVVVPRAWRIAPRLPRDAQDKLPAAALSALFDGDEEGDAEPRATGRPRAPRLLSEAREARRIERRLAVPEDLAQVEGHFEGFPVVPGVVQLAWALAAAAALLGSEPELCALEALKFPVPLRPGGSVRVCVEVAADRKALRFSVHADGAVTASGRARLAEDPRP